MAVLGWTEDLSVGVAVLDGHHKRLFDLLDELYRAVQAGGSETAVGTVLDELVAYTEYHFQEEEKLLEQAGFPALEAHRKVHKALTGQVIRMRDDYKLDPRTVYAAELFQFLSGWLVNHIKVEDFAYKPTLSGV
ncbi:MAG TPA: bacteriohemerythrin [Candidatus Sulfotelmatobacter sp.]|jgi:hemerythrin|nr:bacteriohemerythrin [Candidatus Sulfotelmatobacter sp.]